MGLPEAVFFVIAAIAILAALGVVLHPHPVYSALSLVVALFQIAVLFLLLDAQMVAFLQILVYAGAIMVLFLFVIMLLNVGREEEVASPSWRALTTLVGGITLVVGTADFTLKFGGFVMGGIGTATFGAILLHALLAKGKP